MSSRDSDANYETLAQALPFCWMKEAQRVLNTVTMGLVQTYDPVTKRARVQPALRALFTDGDPPIPPQDKPPIVNVPLRQVSTGDHMMHHEVRPGDVVKLEFSDRGLDQFKAQWGRISNPEPIEFFAERDALATPWGEENITPCAFDGLAGSEPGRHGIRQRGR